MKKRVQCPLCDGNTRNIQNLYECEECGFVCTSEDAMSIRTAINRAYREGVERGIETVTGTKDES